jgi:hypothetical protein
MIDNSGAFQAGNDIGKYLRTKNQPYFLDMENGEKLLFQTIPLELSYNPSESAGWTAIASSGRNNPLYHYTGSEDSLNFTISWYANEESREDVLRNCKWLEALSKNDGYLKKPHRIKLMFGKVFNNTTWIVEKAQYKMSMFQRDKGMLPALAIQEVTLKRLANTNLTTTEIRKIDH